MTDVGTTARKAMSPMRRLRIWEQHGGRCILCKRKIDGVRESWIVEHRIALVLGGPDTDENCGPAHEDCRRVKDKVDVKAGAKCKRQKIKHISGRQSRNPMPGSKASRWRKPFNGPAVLR